MWTEAVWFNLSTKHTFAYRILCPTFQTFHARSLEHTTVAHQQFPSIEVEDSDRFQGTRTKKRQTRSLGNDGLVFEFEVFDGFDRLHA